MTETGQLQAVWTRVQAGQYDGRTMTAGSVTGVSWTLQRQGKGWTLSDGQTERQAATMTDGKALALALHAARLDAERQAAAEAEAEAARQAETAALDATPGATGAYRCQPCKRQDRLTVPAISRMRIAGKRVAVCSRHAAEAGAVRQVGKAGVQGKAAAATWQASSETARAAWRHESMLDALHALAIHAPDAIAVWQRAAQAACPQSADNADAMAARMLSHYVRILQRAGLHAYPQPLSVTVQRGQLKNRAGKALTVRAAARAATAQVRPTHTLSDALDDVALLGILDSDRSDVDTRARSAEDDALATAPADGLDDGILQRLAEAGADADALAALDAQSANFDPVDAEAELRLAVPGALYEIAQAERQAAKRQARAEADAVSEHRSAAVTLARALYRRRAAWRVLQPVKAAERPDTLRAAVQLPGQRSEAVASYWAAA